MKFFIDIDNTICTLDRPMDYASARPIKKAVQKVNALYEAGHFIVFWTARGTVTGKDWRALTEEQLGCWGLKYHQLMFGKPDFDIFIDDKAFNAKAWLAD